MRGGVKRLFHPGLLPDGVPPKADDLGSGARFLQDKARPCLLLWVHHMVWRVQREQESSKVSKSKGGSRRWLKTVSF